MSNRLRRLLGALLLALLAGTGVVATPSPAAAAGPSAIQLSGHGFGHGRGLGQYGAKGYAEEHGWSAAQILGHFYGGTTAGSRPNAVLRVLLCDLEGVTICTSGPGITGVTVTSAQPFHFEGIQNAFPGGTALRITRDGPGQRFLVDRAPGGCGATSFTPVGAGFTGDLVIDLDPGTALLEVCAPKARTYRGNLKVAFTSGKTRVVNNVSAEDYLRGVVPSEMPSSWHAEALKSQAVAARSYALAGDSRFPGLADTCDTIQCQVYLGFSHERPTTNAAVEATAGQVRVNGSAVARTEFSSSTGGYTAGGTFPAVVDEGDATAANPNHNWAVTLQATVIEQAYPAVGDLLNVEVLERNGLGAEGGRVRRLRLVGSSSNVELTGDAFRSKFGLKSDWFTPTRVDITLDRIAAGDRFATAAAIARATFTSAEVALLARGDGTDSFADGLAANHLGGVLGAPTLLTNATSVPAITLSTLEALGVDTVRVLGGPLAISAEVEADLRTAGYDVERTEGADRFATAAAVARAAGPTIIGTVDGKRTAVLSSGRHFADALAAGGMVYVAHFPQLLTEPTALPAATSTVLTELAVKHVLITGGPGAVSAEVESAVQALGITTERVAGATRYETAVALATTALDRMGFSAGHIDVATGENFPDALTGGAHIGRGISTIVLTPREGVPTAVCAFLQARRSSIIAGHVFGGPTAISDATKAALERCLSG